MKSKQACTDAKPSETAVVQQALVSDRPPRDGNTWDCQCARCGSSAECVPCDECGGEGFVDHDCGEDCCCCAEPENNVPCDICRGHGHWYHCISSKEWCEKNPIPGREEMSRGRIEWFVSAYH
jgi:hypothetical protein